jgi:hypothetical protein
MLEIVTRNRGTICAASGSTGTFVGPTAALLFPLMIAVHFH